MSTILKNRKLLIQWSITIILPLLVLLIPVNETITTTLKLFMCITAFIIFVVAFDFFNTAWPAILLPTLYCVLNIAPANIAFGPWTGTTVWMILGAFVLTTALEECGLLRRIALACVRVCGGSFTGTMFGLILAGYVLAWLTFCNHYVVMAMLSYAVCVAMGTGRSKESALLLFAGQIGAGTVQIFTFEAAYNSMMQGSLATISDTLTVPWYVLPVYNLPGLFITLIFFFILTKVFKTKEMKLEGAKDYFDEEYKKLGRVSSRERKAAILLALLMVYLVTTPLHNLPLAYGFMLIPYLMFIPGVKVADSNVITKVNWSVIFFIAACLSIGQVAMYLNLGQIMSDILTPMLDNMGTVPSLLLIYLTGTLANLILTPAAMVTTLTAPLTQIAMDLGISHWPYLMTMIYSTDSVFLPHEIGFLLIFYGFGLMSMKDFVTLNLFKMAVFIILFVILQIPYWYLIGLL